MIIRCGKLRFLVVLDNISLLFYFDELSFSLSLNRYKGGQELTDRQKHAVSFSPCAEFGFLVGLHEVLLLFYIDVFSDFAFNQ